MTKRHLTILLVEDSQTQAAEFLAIAKQITNGHRINTVGTAQDADAAVIDADVMVVDLDLPDSPVAKTVEKIRVWSGILPVVVFSGSEDPQVIEDCVEAGALYFLPKSSLTREAVHSAVRSAIALSHREQLHRATAKLRPNLEE